MPCAHAHVRSLAPKVSPPYSPTRNIGGAPRCTSAGAGRRREGGGLGTEAGSRRVKGGVQRSPSAHAPVPAAVQVPRMCCTLRFQDRCVISGCGPAPAPLFIAGYSAGCRHGPGWRHKTATVGGRHRTKTGNAARQWWRPACSGQVFACAAAETALHAAAGAGVGQDWPGADLQRVLDIPDAQLAIGASRRQQVGAAWVGSSQRDRAGAVRARLRQRAVLPRHVRSVRCSACTARAPRSHPSAPWRAPWLHA